MQKFCPNCGHQVKSIDNVCGNCGTPLKNNQANINREAVSPQRTQKKKHSAYKWVIGVAMVAILAGGGYLVYQNTASANNSAAEKSQSTSSSEDSNSTQNNSSSDEQSSNSTEESNNQEDTSSTDDQENTTSSSDQEDDDENETISDVGPKTAASSILLLGGKKSEVWKSFASQDKLEINVVQPTSESDNDNYSEPGTGVAYIFTADNGKNGGMVLEYRISRDETTVYCYEQSSKDSATRHVTPFATLSAKDIQQVKNSTEVKDLVDKMEVKAD